MSIIVLIIEQTPGDQCVSLVQFLEKIGQTTIFFPTNLHHERFT